VPPDPAGRAFAKVVTCVLLIVTAVVAVPPAVVVCRINEPSSPPEVFRPFVPEVTPLSESIVEVGISYS
jgi:hypothetical protein